MNRLIMIYGCVLLSSTAIAAIQGSPMGWGPLNEMEPDIARYENQVALVDNPTVNPGLSSDPMDNEVAEPYNLDLSTIEFMEEEVVELGFDPYDYLPEDFDPHTFYFDLNGVEYIGEEDLDLGFEAVNYLPKDFDAYSESTDLTSIHFIEEEDLDLGFDSTKYLPEGFSPYKAYFDLSSIRYIEMDDDLEDNFVIPSEIDNEIEPF